MKKRILFICTHNSARSQMAEGLVNHFFSNRWSASSAGTEQTQVKPLAILSMEDIGIGISQQRSKLIDEFEGEQFDVVVTVCDHAKEACPFFPGRIVLHAAIEDPSDVGETAKEKLAAFNSTRDKIYGWLKNNLPEFEKE